ncbi:putative transcription factor C2H2 family [Helianthus annuus]|uniref:Putative zinc finger C2H2-type/integrase DNA-binding domain-containing protein n=1 Tax=Helianthus annuus TaxID=4232 RepID=A0A251SVL9_HELAN|nr:zinc finger protein BALDIBIS [Helianthus annuus]KAF5773486.1 putative transcription factor C2H2 family [Helianthus annuus]KAJ0476956.1 putative transcription factor C2H2 family [Helianthus annuus]KAJ0481331.1 putative transcription factor C2H2 family [Helianthus annuus]KAJ0497799.1 putative transcription factor C2H2 family [Helianthus annuus]KAJ0663808.1 putative transcription factor C2H2 family [Helianthus annuus]
MSGEDLSSSPSSLSAFIQDPISNPNPNSTNSSKRKRNLRGSPDPDAEVVALSPRSLMAKNRFVCEICNKGFQRDQNLQLHRRGHNLPWKLKQRNKLEVVKKKVYICPEISCVHHDPSRALGDLTGVKKHYFRKHGEKKWKCEKCSKKYAVQSDWKAHSKICGTREYKCDCGTIFSRKDSFITHRAFCDALNEENSRMASYPMMSNASNLNFRQDLMTMNSGGGGMRFLGMFGNSAKPILPIWLDRNANDSHFENPNNPSFLGSSSTNNNSNGNSNNNGILPSETVQWLTEDNKVGMQFNSLYNNYTTSTTTPPPPPPHMSATALLQKAAQMGSTSSTDHLVDTNRSRLMSTTSLSNLDSSNDQNNDERLMMMMMNPTKSHDSDFTRDFLGVGGNGRRMFNVQQNMFKFNSSSSSSMQN